MPALASTRRKKQHYKQTFAIKKDGQAKDIVRHTLLVNPEDMSVNEPAKVTATETLGGGYVSDFGSAFKTATLTGITGYKARYNADGELRDGYEEFIHFRNEVYRKFIESGDPALSMYWYNWEDDEYWRIQPTNFRLLRNKNEPLLYRYEFQFTMLQQLNSGASKPKFGVNDIAELNLVGVSESLSSNISSMSEVAGRF